MRWFVLMRVLMANKYLYARAGAETYMLSVAAELKARGHDVAFFGMEHPENTTLGPVTTIPAIEFGVRHGTRNALQNVGRAAIAALTGSTQRRLRGCIAAFRPDVIHAHNIYNQLSPALFVEHARTIPVLMTVHDYKPVCPNYSLFTQGETCMRCLENGFMECVRHRCVQNNVAKSALAAVSSALHRRRKTYIRGYHRFVAPSVFLKSVLVRGGIPEERISVLNNFAAPAAEFSAPGRAILYFGRLCREKGIHTLLKAYAALPEPRPELRIAGEGPLESELRVLALRANLAAVTWLGRIPPAAVARELEDCAFSVVPSEWYENCSMAILESLARGRAVVASDSGGNPELIRPGVDGEMFRAGDSEGLRAKLALLTADAALCETLGRAARESALLRFSPRVHVERLLELYGEVRALFPAALRPAVKAA